jgi:hypothetical protein
VTSEADFFERIDDSRQKREAIVDALREEFPRLASLGVFQLAFLEDALRMLDTADAEAGAIYEDNPRAAARIMVRAYLQLHEAVLPAASRAWPRPATDTADGWSDALEKMTQPGVICRTTEGLLDALDDLDRKRSPEMFSAKDADSAPGAPRIGVNQERGRFWAAVALEHRAVRVGNTDAACKDIAKELGLPRGDWKKLKQWRKDIRQGNRSGVLKQEFERLTKGVARPWPCPEDRKAEYLLNLRVFETMYLKRAQAYMNSAST